MKRLRIAITGSSGFIGSYLVRNLEKIESYNLHLLDISSGIDICNWNQVKDLPGFDVMIHLANKSFVPDSYNDPQSFYQVNFISTLNALELCRIHNSKFIYLSSYVYGHPDYQPIDEKHPVRPFNPYAQSKLICENLCNGYSRDFKIPVIIFRPFNIYGTGQNPSFLIPTIIRQAKDGIISIKDERPKRDYLHVSDLVNAIENSIQYNPENGIEFFNAGSGKSYSVKELADIVIRLCNHKVDYKCTNEFRLNEVMDTVPDITKITKLLNWTPSIPLTRGLEMLFDNTTGK